MSDRWTRIEGIFHEALARAPGERDAFLDGACGTMSSCVRKSRPSSCRPRARDRFSNAGGACHS